MFGIRDKKDVKTIKDLEELIVALKEENKELRLGQKALMKRGNKNDTKTRNTINK